MLFLPGMKILHKACACAGCVQIGDQTANPSFWSHTCHLVGAVLYAKARECQHTLSSDDFHVPFDAGAYRGSNLA